MKLPVIPEDKANHMVYGAVIAGIGSTVSMLTILLFFNTVWQPWQHSISATLGILCSIFAGSAKEFLDNRNNIKNIALGLPPVHGVETLDIVATVQGGIISMIPLIIASIPHLINKHS